MLRLLASAVLLLLVSVPASANWWRRAAPVTVSAYYYPPVVVWSPSYPVVCPPVVTAVPAPTAAPPVHATPVPAPASPAPIRPIPAPQPTPPPAGVRESQSYYDAYAASTAASAPASSTCAVGFWNSTARPVTLRVAGQVYTLAAGRGVMVDLPRQFAWQIDGRESQTTRVPADQVGVDIVIRR